MVRTEIRVPAGDGDIRRCLHAGMLCRLRFAGKRTRRRLRPVTCCPFGIKLGRNHVSEVVLLCTEEPTWKLISLSVPPMNLPLIRLPFFSFKESAYPRDALSHRAMTNPQFSFNFTLTFPSSSRLGWLGISRTVNTWFYLDIFPVSCSGTRSACSGRVDRFKVTATLCARL
jgi:hypothetical protein